MVLRNILIRTKQWRKEKEFWQDGARYNAPRNKWMWHTQTSLWKEILAGTDVLMRTIVSPEEVPPLWILLRLGIIREIMQGEQRANKCVQEIYTMQALMTCKGGAWFSVRRTMKVVDGLLEIEVGYEKSKGKVKSLLSLFIACRNEYLPFILQCNAAISSCRQLGIRIIVLHKRHSCLSTAAR